MGTRAHSRTHTYARTHAYACTLKRTRAHSLLLFEKIVMLSYVMICYFMSRHVMTCHVTICCVMLCCVMMWYIMLWYIVLCYNSGAHPKSMHIRTIQPYFWSRGNLTLKVLSRIHYTGLKMYFACGARRNANACTRACTRRLHSIPHQADIPR